jgi:hypothetical protein
MAEAPAHALIEADTVAWPKQVSKSSMAMRRPGLPVQKCTRGPHPRSHDMTPYIPDYHSSLIDDPFAIMPPRDPNDDDDDEDEDEEDDEDENEEPPVVREPDEE